VLGRWLLPKQLDLFEILNPKTPYRVYLVPTLGQD